MQPKRDPNDRRYWPLALGGTGDGFTGKDRKDHPRRFNALAKSRERRKMPHPSIDAIRNGSTPEAIRARARLILDMALDRVEDALEDANPLPLKDLTGTIGALGRIAGVQSTDVNVTGSVGHLHLEAMLAPKLTPSNEVLPRVDTPQLQAPGSPVEGAGEGGTITFHAPNSPQTGL